MDKRFHSDSRSSENFTIKGLQTITGQSQSDWITYITKELVDNSLEGCEDPKIEITCWMVDEELEQLDVQDNGPGITKKTIMKIFKDIESFGGTKSHYKLTTRGSQGNALMSIFGIQSQFSRSLEIHSRNYLHIIKMVSNDLSNEPEVKVETKQVENIKGLKISFYLPDSVEVENDDYDEGYGLGGIEDVKKVFRQFVELNPQAEIKLIIRNKKRILSEWLSEKTGEVQSLTLGRKTTTGKVIWFSPSDFVERLKADIRVEPKLPFKDWIGEFYGFTSPEKVNQMIPVFDSRGEFDTIKDFFREKKFLAEDAIRLFLLMRENTNTFREDRLATTLGSIGRERMKSALLRSLDLLADDKFLSDNEDYSSLVRTWDQILGHHSAKESKIQSIDDLFFYSGKGGIYETKYKTTPFYFELIAIPISWKKRNYPGEEMTFGINQSFIYSVPDISIGIKHRKEVRSFHNISEPFRELGYKFKIVCNLTCPTVDYQDRGKQLFETTPFSQVIEEVVGKIIRKIKDNLSPILNSMNKKPKEVTAPEPKERKEGLANKAPYSFVKDFIFDNFMRVYNEATENGKYILTKRQFYYAMRKHFMAVIEEKGYKWKAKSTIYDRLPLELDSGYFAMQVGAYETKVLRKRIIYREVRGFFAEPHSGLRVDLSTADVKSYTPDLSQFNNLLFVEKRGFYEQIHNNFKLTKKYDLGLISSQGYATLALRDLVEEVQRKKPEVKLYTLTDLDIAGIGIKEDVKKKDELSDSVIDIFNCVPVGLRIEDVEKYGLEPEKANYKEMTFSQLKNRYKEGKVEEKLFQWLMKDQRVELNVFTPRQLKDYLETRFKELRIEKLKPEEEDVDTFEVESPDVFYRGALWDAVSEHISKSESRLFNYLKEKVKVEDSEAEKKLKELSEDQQKIIYEQILEELKKFPLKNWVMINNEIVEDIESEHTKIKNEYEAEVREKAKEILKKYIEVEIRIRK